MATATIDDFRRLHARSIARLGERGGAARLAVDAEMVCAAMYASVRSWAGGLATESDERAPLALAGFAVAAVIAIVVVVRSRTNGPSIDDRTLASNGTPAPAVNTQLALNQMKALAIQGAPPPVAAPPPAPAPAPVPMLASNAAESASNAAAAVNHQPAPFAPAGARVAGSTGSAAGVGQPSMAARPGAIPDLARPLPWRWCQRRHHHRAAHWRRRPAWRSRRNTQSSDIISRYCRRPSRTGRTDLSCRPIQFAFESPKFMLPIRLGMINAQGPLDLIIYLLTKDGRVETTNYRTVKMPAGMDLPLFVQDDFDNFTRRGSRARQ